MGRGEHPWQNHHKTVEGSGFTVEGLAALALYLIPYALHLSNVHIGKVVFRVNQVLLYRLRSKIKNKAYG